jgi:YHS domain-containing protein
MRVFASVIVFVVMAGSVAFIAGAAADKPAATSQPAATTKPATVASSTPVNKKCPISGDDVDPKGKTVQYKGKTVGFCCDDCIEKFNQNPDKYADKIK